MVSRDLVVRSPRRAARTRHHGRHGPPPPRGFRDAHGRGRGVFPRGPGGFSRGRRQDILLVVVEQSPRRRGFARDRERGLDEEVPRPVQGSALAEHHGGGIPRARALQRPGSGRGPPGREHGFGRRGRPRARRGGRQPAKHALRDVRGRERRGGGHRGWRRARGPGERCERARSDRPPGPRREGEVPDRRQRQHQRRRVAARAIRVAARHGARSGSRARGRPRAGPFADFAQGQHRVRPEAAVHRGGGNARRDHEDRPRRAPAADRDQRRVRRRAEFPRRRRGDASRETKPGGRAERVRVSRPRQLGAGAAPADRHEGPAAAREVAVLRRRRGGGDGNRRRSRARPRDD